MIVTIDPLIQLQIGRETQLIFVTAYYSSTEELALMSVTKPKMVPVLIVGRAVVLHYLEGCLDFYFRNLFTCHVNVQKESYLFYHIFWAFFHCFKGGDEQVPFVFLTDITL